MRPVYVVGPVVDTVHVFDASRSVKQVLHTLGFSALLHCCQEMKGPYEENGGGIQKTHGYQFCQRDDPVDKQSDSDKEVSAALCLTTKQTFIPLPCPVSNCSHIVTAGNTQSTVKA